MLGKHNGDWLDVHNDQDICSLLLLIDLHSRIGDRLNLACESTSIRADTWSNTSSRTRPQHYSRHKSDVLLRLRFVLTYSCVHCYFDNAVHSFYSALLCWGVVEQALVLADLDL